MPRFVILRHDSPRGLHWDLLLESGSVLRSWSLPQEPEPQRTLTCEWLPDHRLAYLDYEGELSGGRGSVSRWDQGVYTTHRDTGDELVIDLRGERLIGRVFLLRLPGDPERWQFRVSGTVRESPSAAR